MSDNADQAALIERMIVSKFWNRAEGRSDLLRFLFQHKGRLLSSKDIEVEFFGGNPANDTTRVRVAILGLKKAIDKYDVWAKDERLKCEILNADDAGGYQLTFQSVAKGLSATRLFWKAHLEAPEDMILVTGWRLFFFDPTQNAVLRYYGVKVGDKTKELLPEDLKELAPRKDYEILEALPNHYLSAGDVEAYDILMRWVFAQTGFLIRRTTSRDIQDREIQRRSPILVGRPGSNHFIKRFLSSSQGMHLAYRIPDATKGAIQIVDINDNERTVLKDYPISPEGVVGPDRKGESVFGIVARLRNPSGYGGHVTVISCDLNARIVARIMEVLTSERDASNLLEKMNWPKDRDLPESFEMLFSIALLPGGLEGEGFPRFLCWRRY
jgi:hypothetical protein